MNVSAILPLLWSEILSETSHSLRVVLAIAIGVGGVTGIHSYKFSIQDKLFVEAKKLMGADLMVESPERFRDFQMQLLDKTIPAGSQTAETVEFASMLQYPQGKESSLTTLKALDPNFPLIGEIETEPPGAWKTLKPDEILVEASLVEKLGTRIGATLRVGEKNFRLAGLVRKEPGSMGSFAGFAPSSVILRSSLAETQLEGRGSRIRYKKMIQLPPGTPGDIWKEEQFDTYIQNDLTIYHHSEVSSGSQKFLKNTLDYLGLLALSSFFVGALTIYLSIRKRVNDKTNEIALMKCLGATHSFSVVFLLIEVSVLAVTGTILGIWIGYGLQFAIPNIAESTILLEIEPTLTPLSLVWSLLLGIFVPVFTAMDSLFRVKNISPLLALRSDATNPLSPRNQKLRTVLILASIWIFFLGIAFLETKSILGAVAFALVLGMVPLLLYLFYLLFQTTAKQILKLDIPNRERLVLRKFSRPGPEVLTSILGLGSGLFIFLLSFFLRESLLTLGGAREIEKRPNVFVIDIRDKQKDGFLEISQSHKAQMQITVPVIGARLTTINGQPVQKELNEKNAVERNWRTTARTREYFLSYRSNLYETESVTKGRFWATDAKDEISIETDFAKTLGVDVGDRLGFQVQGRLIEGKITNLRSVTWSDMKPNFVVLFSKGTLEKAPGYFISSFHIEDANTRSQFIKTASLQYPTITIFDTEKAVQGFMGILQNVTKLINLMSYLLFGACLLLIVSSLSNGNRERSIEVSLLRIVGANSRFLKTCALMEGLFLSLVSFVLGFVLAYSSEALISRFVLKMRSVTPWDSVVWIFCISVGLTVVLYGWSVLRNLKRSTKASLRL